MLASSLFAHDLWIEPSTFRPKPGERVTAALRVGQNLQGDPMARIPPLVDRFMLAGANGDTPLLGRAGADPAGIVLVSAPGLQWIGYQSNAYPVTLEAKKFEEYLTDEGLEPIIAARAKNGQATAAGRERFYRCAKSLLDAGGGTTSADQPLHFTLELVPRKNPYALHAGDKLPVTLLYRGQPLPHALVVAMNKNDPTHAARVRTDAKGRAMLPLARAGFWLIKAVHMEAAPPDAGVDWESWWASVTFDLQ